MKKFSFSFSDFQTLVLLILLLNSSQFMMAQEKVSSFDSSYFEKQHFAHRGGYANGPENTIQTILWNIQHGTTAVEIDVVLTADQELVLFHDDTINCLLQRDEKRYIDEMNWAEIKTIPLRDESQGLQYTARLEDLIDTLTVLIPKQDLQFILEVNFKPKDEDLEAAVNELMRILNKEKAQFDNALYDYFFISSFYPHVLKAVRKKDSLINLAFAVNSNPPEKKLLAKMAFWLAPYYVKKHKVRIIEPEICLITKRFVDKWHKRSRLINAFTANTECQKNYINQFPIAYSTNCPIGHCKNDKSDLIGKRKWCKYCE